MTTPSCLVLLVSLLAMCADRPGRERLLWLLVGSFLSPLCAALALLVTKSSSDDGSHRAPGVWSAHR